MKKIRAPPPPPPSCRSLHAAAAHASSSTSTTSSCCCCSSSPYTCHSWNCSSLLILLSFSLRRLLAKTYTRSAARAGVRRLRRLLWMKLYVPNALARARRRHLRQQALRELQRGRRQRSVWVAEVVPFTISTDRHTVSDFVMVAAVHYSNGLPNYSTLSYAAPLRRRSAFVWWAAAQLLRSTRVTPPPAAPRRPANVSSELQRILRI